MTDEQRKNWVAGCTYILSKYNKGDKLSNGEEAILAAYHEMNAQQLKIASFTNRMEYLESKLATISAQLVKSGN